MSSEVAVEMDGGRWKKYPVYRDSGVEWLGEVPEGWNVLRIGDLTNVTKLAGYEYTEYFEYIHNGEIIALRVLNLNQGKLNLDNIQKITREISDKLPRSKLYKGDLLLSYVGTVGSLAIVPEDDKYHLAPNVSKITVKSKDKTYPVFLMYYLMSKNGKYELFSYVSKTSQPVISMGKIRKIRLFSPPLPEQHAIAAFLDRETGRIDTLIKKKERQIELLREKHAALISHAVTKGLDPNVRKKDSGVEWLGEVPEGWMIKRIGIDTKSLTGFAFESEQFSYEDEHIKLVRGDNVTTGKLRWGDKTRRWSEISNDLERYLLEENDIVIGMDGSKVGRNYAIAKEEDLPLILVQRVARIRCMQSLIPRFLYYFIANDMFSYYVNTTKTDPAVPHITLKNIRDYSICFPPLPEQRAIAAFLDTETGHIDTLTTKIQTSISKLSEYRTSLISDAVTGKIDVRQEVMT